LAITIWYLLYRTKTGKVVGQHRRTGRWLTPGINMTALFTLVFGFGRCWRASGRARGAGQNGLPGVGTEVIMSPSWWWSLGLEASGERWSIASQDPGDHQDHHIPEFEMAFIYLLMVVILVVRPGILEAGQDQDPQ
jgi:branched-subunit amino acid ABC-type transport system permease component